jgi:hypothetical protein
MKNTPNLDMEDDLDFDGILSTVDTLRFYAPEGGLRTDRRGFVEDLEYKLDQILEEDERQEKEFDLLFKISEEELLSE